MSTTPEPSSHAHPATLAIVRRRLLEALRAGLDTAGEPARLVEVDGVLSGLVLRTVRSPVYRVELVDEFSAGAAAARLGTDLLLHMASWLPVPTHRRDQDRARRACARWLHGIAVAAAARAIAETTDAVPPSEAYTAGLLHDVGAVEAEPNESIHIQAARTQQMLGDWMLPAHLGLAARLHQKVLEGFPTSALAVAGTPLDDATRALVDLVARADAVATTLGYDDGHEESVAPGEFATQQDLDRCRAAVEVEILAAAELLGLETTDAGQVADLLVAAEIRDGDEVTDSFGALAAPPRSAAQVASVHRKLVAARESASVAGIMEDALTVIREGLGFDRLFLFDPEPEHPGRLRGRMAIDCSHLAPARGVHGIEFDLGPGSLLEASMDGGTAMLVDAAGDDRDALRGLGVTQCVAAPLRAPSRSFGVVMADNFFSGRQMTAADASSLGLLCDSLGLVLENVALDVQGKKLRSLAEKDELTGINNRRNIVALLQREIERARRFHSPLSIALIDVDHFKRWNDLHGHQVGDMVLQAVAQLIASCSREVDSYGRYGGEEFLIILPETAMPHAVLYAERLRITMSERGGEALATYAGTSLRVSIGVTSLDPANDDVDSMIRRSDAALYAAKKHGRDRVCVEGATAPMSDWPPAKIAVE